MSLNLCFESMEDLNNLGGGGFLVGDTDFIIAFHEDTFFIIDVNYIAQTNNFLSELDLETMPQSLPKDFDINLAFPKIFDVLDSMPRQVREFVVFNIDLITKSEANDMELNPQLRRVLAAHAQKCAKRNAEKV